MREGCRLSEEDIIDVVEVTVASCGGLAVMEVVVGGVWRVLPSEVLMGNRVDRGCGGGCDAGFVSCCACERGNWSGVAVGKGAAVEGGGSFRPGVRRETPPPVNNRPVVVLDKVVKGTEREGVLVVENWPMAATVDAAVVDCKANFIPASDTSPILVPAPD